MGWKKEIRKVIVGAKELLRRLSSHREKDGVEVG